MKVLESPFVSDVMDAFAPGDGAEAVANASGKIVFLGFDSLEFGDWRPADFVWLCRRAPVLFVDHAKPISLNHRELVSRFRDLVGGVPGPLT